MADSASQSEVDGVNYRTLSDRLDAIDVNIIEQGGISSGAEGAELSVRLRGGNASGPPLSGTHAVRDYVVNDDGSVWVCTVAGTPGTWVQVGPADLTPYATKAATSDLIDTAGDSLTGTADNTLGKFAKGTAFQVRRMNSAANAEEWGPPPSLDSVGSSVPSGRYLLSSGGLRTTATDIAGGSVCIHPRWNPQAITVDRVGAEITTANANGYLMGLALYTGTPFNWTLVHTFGTIPTSANGVGLITGSWVIPVGWVWWGMGHNGGASTLPTYRAVTVDGGWTGTMVDGASGSPGTGQLIGYRWNASSFGAPPAAASIHSMYWSPPVIIMRKA